MTRREKKIAKLVLEIEALHRSLPHVDPAEAFIRRAAIDEKTDILFDMICNPTT